MLDQSGLAGAGVSDDPQELALGDVQVDMVNGSMFKGCAHAVAVGQILYSQNRCHDLPRIR